MATSFHLAHRIREFAAGYPHSAEESRSPPFQTLMRRSPGSRRSNVGLYRVCQLETYQIESTARQRLVRSTQNITPILLLAPDFLSISPQSQAVRTVAQVTVVPVRRGYVARQERYGTGYRVVKGDRHERIDLAIHPSASPHHLAWCRRYPVPEKTGGIASEHMIRSAPVILPDSSCDCQKCCNLNASRWHVCHALASLGVIGHLGIAHDDRNLLLDRHHGAIHVSSTWWSSLSREFWSSRSAQTLHPWQLADSELEMPESLEEPAGYQY